MKSCTALLLCSTAALVTFTAAGQATIDDSASARVATAQSYADLLAPIPNAVEALQADDAAQVFRPRARVQLAQYHHHHGSVAGGIIGLSLIGALGGALAPPPPDYYYHCYWMLGRRYWNGYRWVHPRVRVCD